jgi:hypothetical protein
MIAELEVCGFAPVSLKALTPRQKSRGFLPLLKPGLKVGLLSSLASGWFHWSETFTAEKNRVDSF